MSRSELLTTVILSNAIRAPAIAGESKNPYHGKRMPAAIGIPKELYQKDQIRFCQIVLFVFLARFIASATLPISP